MKILKFFVLSIPNLINNLKTNKDNIKTDFKYILI